MRPNDPPYNLVLCEFNYRDSNRQNETSVDWWIKRLTDRLSGKNKDPMFYLNGFHKIREYQGYIRLNNEIYSYEEAILLTIEQLLTILTKYKFLLKNYKQRNPSRANAGRVFLQL